MQCRAEGPDRSEASVRGTNFNCVQMRVSGCRYHYNTVLRAGAKVEERSDEIPPWRGKNCDEQLTHIVRVMGSCSIYHAIPCRHFDYASQQIFVPVYPLVLMEELLDYFHDIYNSPGHSQILLLFVVRLRFCNHL